MGTDRMPFVESAWVAGFRFAIELAAWIAIYLAWGWIALVFAVAALALFSVPGDKHVVLVRIPGPLRILLEAGIAILGAIAARRLWGPAAGGTLLAATALLFALSRRRMAWLWSR